MQIANQPQGQGRSRTRTKEFYGSSIILKLLYSKRVTLKIAQPPAPANSETIVLSLLKIKYKMANYKKVDIMKKKPQLYPPIYYLTNNAFGKITSFVILI